MPSTFHYRLFILIYKLPLLLLLFSCETTPPPAKVTPEALFAFEVHPLLETKCFNCHGEDSLQLEGGLDMRSRQGLLNGGASGQPALIPGNPEQSLIYLAAGRRNPDLAMPPKENDRLTEHQLKMLQDWIRGGAPWPDEAKREQIIAEVEWDYQGKIPVETSGGLSGSWTNRRYSPEDLWAFLPVEQPPIPWEYVAGNVEANPIDAFIGRKLHEIGLSPAEQADRHDLIRRATYDLTGLPPTPEEVENFIHDPADDAFSKVIERLLNSPHYGEQWARHWLDVVRYADSDGLANDYARPNAWRYRDYVVRAFNDDKPYDQFIIEQLAGDELAPQNPEMLIATGFLRMGPWEHTGMSIEAETRQFFLDDVTNSVGEVFLAQPLRCARCHDHKFDPIPTRDFYRIQAVFATTQFAERPAAYLPTENDSIGGTEKQMIEDFIAKAESKQKAIAEKEEKAARRWMEERGLKYLPKRQRRKLPENQQPPRYHGLNYQELGYRKLLNKHIQRKRRELEGFGSLAYSVYNGPRRLTHSARPIRLPKSIEGEPEQTSILAGGSVYAPTSAVEPGILSALPGLQHPVAESRKQKSLDVDLPATMNYRRLHFARWVAHPDNPLTTRAVVNRIWQYHFGKGIAENANNFGITGKKPTHPELLDWLARWFVDNDWSIKELHRLIMTSEAYQRSTRHSKINQIRQLDPNNNYLAMFEPRRLAAEEMRDAMLAVSGELNHELGGRPARPEIHQEVALQPRQVMGSVAPAYQPSPTRLERNRRTIYSLRLRGITDPMLEVFNRPGPDLSCERRSTSSITPQVFMLFNDRGIRARAIALAKRIAADKKGVPGSVADLFELVLGRTAGREEIADAAEYVHKMLLYHQEHAPPVDTLPRVVEREMFEEMTGETFKFEEELTVYQNYEADLAPWQVDAETRALADLAMTLFNSNEFIYVY